MERVKRQEIIEERRDQLRDIILRLEYLAEKEPEILNYIQRTVEGLSTIDDDAIKLENSTKLLAMKTIGRIKTERGVRGIFNIAQAIEQKEKTQVK